MARIRTTKPEFWTSAQVMECSPICRLLFLGMWNFADDAGRMAYSPKTSKAQVFPSDDISIETITGMIDELSTNDLVQLYEVDGKRFIQITGWHHQRIDKPKPSKIPEPSTNDLRRVAPDLIVSEGNGREGKVDAAVAAHSSNPETDYFRRVKEICGPSSGGLAKKLLTAKGNSVPQARAAIEQASEKSDPREYLGAIIRTREAECQPDRSF